MTCQNADYAEPSRHPHFLCSGLRSFHTRFLYLFKSLSAGFFDLIFQSVRGFKDVLRYSACALGKVFLDAIAIFSDHLVLEVEASEGSGDRGPNGKTHRTKHERLSLKQIRKR